MFLRLYDIQDEDERKTLWNSPSLWSGSRSLVRVCFLFYLANHSLPKFIYSWTFLQFPLLTQVASLNQSSCLCWALPVLECREVSENILIHFKYVCRLTNINALGMKYFWRRQWIMVCCASVSFTQWQRECLLACSGQGGTIQ